MSPDRSHRPLKRIHVLGLAGLCVAAGATAAWMIAARPTRDIRAPLFLLLLATGSALVLVDLLRHHWRRSAFEPPEIELVNARPRLGESVQFDVRVCAVRRARVRRVAAMLSCVEELRDERGQGRVLPTVVHREEIELARDLTFETPGPVFLHGRLTVPVDAMQSFESHLCAVRWRLEAVVSVGSRPSFRERVELGVQPVREQASATTEARAATGYRLQAPGTTEATEATEEAAKAMPRIELASDRVCVGEMVKGRLRLGGPGAGKEATVSLAWRTHAEGIEDEGRIVAEHRIPFTHGAEFSLDVPPAGPMTYTGAAFSIAWVVRAQTGASPEPCASCPVIVGAAFVSRA